MRDDGNADRCFVCVKLDPNTIPLLHPAILIPTPPVGKPFTGMIRDPRNPKQVIEKKLMHWRYEFIKLCVPHARMMLNEMKDDELNARAEG